MVKSNSHQPFDELRVTALLNFSKTFQLLNSIVFETV